jgi:aspartate racemase
MKTLGVLGGMGPESTIEYYRLLIETYRKRQPDDSYPSIVVNSVNLTEMLGFLRSSDLAGLAGALVRELAVLERAGAAVCLISANTPHIVFDDVRRRTRIPLISIVESTRDAAKALGLARPGLFATSFTIKGGFYQEVFARAGMTVVVPEEDEQAAIHHIYMNELIVGDFRQQARDRLLQFAEDLKARRGMDGLILGGTELPLVLRDTTIAGVPVLDTTRIHVDAAIAWMLA